MIKQYSIDAAGKKLGRVASVAAKALMGKTSADYTPHIASSFRVSISNAKKMIITEKKRNAKIYTDYSGHPSGLRRESLSSLIGRKGHGAALKRAIERMLPRNASRKIRMKRLQISE